MALAVVGLSLRRPQFDLGPVRVKFVVDKMILRRVFLRVFRFLLIWIIPPVLNTHIRLKTTFIREIIERSLGTYKGSPFRMSGEQLADRYFQIQCSKGYMQYCNFLSWDADRYLNTKELKIVYVEIWVRTGLGSFTASNSNTLELCVLTEFIFYVKEKKLIWFFEFKKKIQSKPTADT
jgi:hypothetical protein